MFRRGKAPEFECEMKNEVSFTHRFTGLIFMYEHMSVL
jgi:hypothetical protein